MLTVSYQVCWCRQVGCCKAVVRALLGINPVGFSVGVGFTHQLWVPFVTDSLYNCYGQNLCGVTCRIW